MNMRNFGILFKNHTFDSFFFTYIVHKIDVNRTFHVDLIINRFLVKSFQTITKPDSIYFNHLQFLWFLFHIYSSHSLAKRGNFIQNEEKMY